MLDRPDFGLCLLFDYRSDVDIYISGPDITTPRIENKFFWPAVTAVALGCLALRNRSRLTWPPHIVWFAAYLALAGASILWAFKPEFSFIRFSTQMMMLISLFCLSWWRLESGYDTRCVFLLRIRFDLECRIDTRRLFEPESVADGGKIGYPGYFTFKGELGEFAAFAFLLSLYEIFHPGWRRALGLIVVVISIYLIIVSKSKGSFGYVLLAAILATLVLLSVRKCAFPQRSCCYPCQFATSSCLEMVGNLINRISWYIYGNYHLEWSQIYLGFREF